MSFDEWSFHCLWYTTENLMSILSSSKIYARVLALFSASPTSWPRLYRPHPGLIQLWLGLLPLTTRWSTLNPSEPEDGRFESHQIYKKSFGQILISSMLLIQILLIQILANTSDTWVTNWNAPKNKITSSENEMFSNEFFFGIRFSMKKVENQIESQFCERTDQFDENFTSCKNSFYNLTLFQLFKQIFK